MGGAAIVVGIWLYGLRALRDTVTMATLLVVYSIEVSTSVVAWSMPMQTGNERCTVNHRNYYIVCVRSCTMVSEEFSVMPAMYWVILVGGCLTSVLTVAWVVRRKKKKKARSEAADDEEVAMLPTASVTSQ
jgi:hypothetical protein